MSEDSAEAYARQTAEQEIPNGMLDCLRELAPEIGDKYPLPSLRTCQRYMVALGFRWEHWRKAKYFDGHEREDVVKYRQEVFIPRLFDLRPHLVEFKSPTEEVEKD